MRAGDAGPLWDGEGVVEVGAPDYGDVFGCVKTVKFTVAGEGVEKACLWVKLWGGVGPLIGGLVADDVTAKSWAWVGEFPKPGPGFRVSGSDGVGAVAPAERLDDTASDDGRRRAAAYELLPEV